MLPPRLIFCGSGSSDPLPIGLLLGVFYNSRLREKARRYWFFVDLYLSKDNIDNYEPILEIVYFSACRVVHHQQSRW